MAAPRFKKRKIRAIWLGKALEEIRLEAGLTARDAAAHLSRDPSSISRMEDGRIPVSEDILNGYLDMCGITDTHKRADLATIRRDAAQSGWWDGYSGDVASTLMDRAWIESKAVQIKAFDITYFPGLLQTPDYAEALMRAGTPTPLSDEEIARWSEVRMTRQHIVTGHKPVKLRCIIDEKLLTRAAGGAETMRAQLDYLVTCSDRPNIEIRILGSDSCFGISGSFEVLTLVDPYPEVAYVATPAGDICVEGDSVDYMTQAYDRLLGASMSAAASKKLIIAERDKL